MRDLLGKTTVVVGAKPRSGA